MVLPMNELSEEGHQRTDLSDDLLVRESSGVRVGP